MSDVFVCRQGEMKDGSRRIVEANGVEIGIYRQAGQYYAYRNLCTHQGGPACEGELIPKVEDIIDEKKEYHGQRFSETEIHIVCPWHSYEFNLATGVCVSDAKLKLRKFPVLERDGGIYVQI